MSDSAEEIGQDEIEELLRQAQSEGGATAADVASDLPPPADSATPAAAPNAEPPTSFAGDASDIDLLLQQAEQAVASIDQPTTTPDSAIPFQFRNLSGTPANSEQATLELIQDVDLDVRIELGRTQMQLDEVLQLKQGSVVSLDRLAGDPVDVFVNGRLIARGEVLVLNDNFCIRVAELVASNQTE